jgi:hypothetical protein
MAGMDGKWARAFFIGKWADYGGLKTEDGERRTEVFGELRPGGRAKEASNTRRAREIHSFLRAGADACGGQGTRDLAQNSIAAPR